MNAGLGILQGPCIGEGVPTESADFAVVDTSRPDRWDPDRFAAEQIRALVRKVFLPGWPRPAKQVVFSAVDTYFQIATVCRRVGEMLAAEKVGRVCLVEADLGTRALEQSFGRTSNDGTGVLDGAGAVRDSSRQISNNLWLVPANVFVGRPENAHSAAWLRARLGEVRREFDYAVIHADAAGIGSASGLVAHLSDGLVLGLTAHRTRRIAARKVRDHLLATNVRLLGFVLSERTFPIPESLYRRL